MDFVLKYSFLIPLLPLFGAAVAGFAGAKWLKGQSHWPIWIGVGASAVMSIVLLVSMLGGHHAAVDEAAGPSGTVTTAADGNSHIVKWFNWFSAGDNSAPFHAGRPKVAGFIDVSAGAFIDPLTAVMLAVVCGIGFLITVFSKGYMQGEAGYFRFFAYLGLFIFAMTCLVMGDNLLLLYLGWEGVGLCSYLLVGYYYDKPAAREAAKKAFIVNRIGDLGFVIGIMLVFLCFGTVSFFGTGVGTHTGFIEMALDPVKYAGDRAYLLPWIPFCLMIGAFGKSAQFPLYVWLPDAMEGPTPVSALIHAATMVTAGVYMIARLGTLFVGEPAALVTIAVVGSFTALFAGSIALRQFDLKKIFAYSTVSQLGYMFVGVAVLAPVAGVFHLITHAFFKALLFLSAGVVMHAMHGELDLRKMSGLKHKLPKTRIFVLIGCLALAGFPLFSGFWSKDEIVAAAGEKSIVLQIVLLLTSLLTAYYTFRLYFRVFEGPEVIPTGHEAGGVHDAESAAIEAHSDDVTGAKPLAAHSETHGAVVRPAHDHGASHVTAHAHHNPEPWVMMLPLALLALGAVFVGAINLPLGGESVMHRLGHFLGRSPSFELAFEKAHAKFGDVDPAGFGQAGGAAEFHVMPLIVGGAVSLLGIALAYFFHLKDRAAADRLANKLGPITRGIEAKYWIDELYHGLIVVPLRTAGRILYAIDRFVIDGIVVLVGLIPQLSGFGLKLTGQRGYLQGYALGMMLGIAAILWLVLGT